MVLRILQVVPSLEMGGVETGTIDVAYILQKNNMVPFVASSGGKMVSLLDKQHIKHFQFWFHSKNPIIMLYNMFVILFIIYIHKINIVHARSRAPAWSSWLACKISNTKFVTTYHNRPNGTDFFIKKWYNQIMTWGVKVISPSHFVKHHIVKYYHRKPEDVVTIYRGVNCQEFNNTNVPDEYIQSLKNKYSISNEHIVISLPGRLASWKGHMVFLKAIQLLHADYNLKCLFVGNGCQKYKQKLTNYINAHSLPVTIDTSCENISAMYALSDIVVSASVKEETFGRVAVEGQASGKIVIATNIGGSLETIIDNKTGFLIHPDDPYALADKIRECLHNHCDFSKKNYQSIINQSKKFDISIFEENIIKFYNSL